MKRCVGPVAVADGKRAPVRAEGECANWPDERAAVAELVARLEARAEISQRACVEEGDTSVIAADGERVAIGGERIVEDTCNAAALQDCEGGRAAQKRGKEIASRRGRVVELDSFACQ